MCSRWFLGPTKVVDANGISIASAFLQGSLGDRPTDRPTDHSIRSLTIGKAHSGEAIFCYCLRLQQETVRREEGKGNRIRGEWSRMEWWGKEMNSFCVVTGPGGDVGWAGLARKPTQNFRWLSSVHNATGSTNSLIV